MARVIQSRCEAVGRAVSAEVQRKMSILPSDARLLKVPDDEEEWPILQCANFFVLPGVPEFFATKVTAIAQHFLQGRPPALARRVLLCAEEEAIVQGLDAVVADHPAVAFGSYP